MRRAGFVLVGGRSDRMGRDKALLPCPGGPLVGRVASLVAAAAGSVTLVGHPERYLHLPYPAISDRYPDTGPVGGIHAALETTVADWNLIVACDMPGLSAESLRAMLDRAEDTGVDCLAAQSPSGFPEPLCAVYHRRCASEAAAWLDSGRRKAAGWLSTLRMEWYPLAEERLRNLNTPEEWDRYLEGPNG